MLVKRMVFDRPETSVSVQRGVIFPGGENCCVPLGSGLLVACCFVFRFNKLFLVVIRILLARFRCSGHDGVVKLHRRGFLAGNGAERGLRDPRWFWYRTFFCWFILLLHATGTPRRC